ncbi:MAG: hypothetical protein A2Y64_05025 [Candidatus Coatesbacteria bacterium RBG_13_66_14]|uniref:Cupin 2 conserved barrel domain-containing protein n=1 Tax=Candidatus Coatesbacteria bacterium RBG_13_66_14 TaxID=1817816 RepID=A0A1F5EYI5_9BACT|nr:MAG: hypothetical protein A2Y64_05025 [Candidatus Coatesbacteria bacterium RBG_13_66_14]
MEVHSYDQREKNVLHQATGFKMRVIHLTPGGGMPECRMATHVVLVCVEGCAEVTADGEKVALSRGQCLVTPPATLTMESQTGARILGIQIAEGD